MSIYEKVYPVICFIDKGVRTMKKRYLASIVTIVFFLGLTFYFLINNEDTSIQQEEESFEEKIENIEKMTNVVEETLEKEVSNKIAETVHEAIESTKQMIQNLGHLRITLIGDSLTAGVGDETDDNGYEKVLEAYLTENYEGPFTIDNFGKRGNRSDQLLERLQEQEITSSIERANVIFITIGANDIMKIVKENIFSLSYDDFLVEQKGYEERLRSIFTEIRKKNKTAHIYLIGLYNPFDEYFGDIPELERIIDDWNWIGHLVVKEQQHATFVPIKNAFQKSEENLFSEDHFHPNHKGYTLIGEVALEYLIDTFHIVE